MPPSPLELLAEIDACMLRDRFHLRRRLGVIRARGAMDSGFEQLALDIAKSRARRVERAEKRPVPTYPAELPIVQRKDEIAEAISKSQVVVVCGETGSGKTTQLPKICLELGRGTAGLIGHTQPRRLAARTLAARIASELETEVGGAVGYKIRFSDKVSDATYIKLMTDGILLAETQGDRFLEQYDTILIDEAHERSINIDFLLGYLRRLLPKRPDLKVIVTSATIDPERFSQHFGGAPIINVSGRLHPVEIRYRPPATLTDEDEEDDDPRREADAMQEGILAAVRELPRDGDVLVFLPGEQAIRDTNEALRKEHPARTEILPLYARLSAGEQGRVFRSGGGRRIILSTNVAETSLTVPGVRYVIDTGLARISRYDTRRKVQRLPIERISQASANQRTGRAGRTSAGICIRLYSEEDFAARAVFTPPEIVRTNLASVILQMAALGLGTIEEFPFVEPPGTRAVRDGAATLFELGALDEAHGLTRIGRELARLPVDPRVGRIILAGREHECVTEVLVIAAALSVQDPRERPHDAREKADQAHRAFAVPDSDFATYLKIWDAYQDEATRVGSSKLRKWCEARFLSFVRMREWQDVHRQLSELVKTMGFGRARGSGDDASLHKALLTGYLGSVAMKLDDRVYVGAHNLKVNLHPSSVLFKKRPPFIMAAEIVETAKLYARTVAKIDPEWIEPLAEHMVERRYFEPHWDKSRGQVVGFEKVLLHGLTIVAKRRVDFARVDPETAREIFIREALMTGEVESHAPFLRHNKEVVASVESLADRARRRDIAVNADSIYVFFDKVIPPHVNSSRHFESWRKKVEAETPRALYLSRDDILVGDAAAVTTEQYPDVIDALGLTLPLRYRFAPGEEDDGVTATIPLAALGKLDPTPFEWLVPGMLADKANSLLESLPKAIRKNFVPVREVAERFAQVPRASERESLFVALARFLQGEKRISVTAADFRREGCPEYLFTRFRVIDEVGKVVAEGRDLDELQRRFGERARQSFGRAGKGEYERDSITTWDFGDLPDEVEIRHGAFVLPSYPALTVENGEVALRLFQRRADAMAEHRRGVARLFAIRLGETAKQVRRSLPGIQAMSLQFTMVASGDALRDDLLAAAIDRACIGDGEPPPRTQAEFERRVLEGRGKLAAHADQVCARVAPVLAGYQGVVRLLASAAPKNAPNDGPWKDIRDHLARLVYAGFVSTTPPSRLPQLERYLKAATLRVSRLAQSPMKDRERAAQFAPHWQKYVTHDDAIVARLSGNVELERYRWLLEEWRVSLFAQDLRTVEPVSEKKIAEQWTKVMDRDKSGAK